MEAVIRVYDTAKGMQADVQFKDAIDYLAEKGYIRPIIEADKIYFKATTDRNLGQSYNKCCFYACKEAVCKKLKEWEGVYQVHRNPVSNIFYICKNEQRGVSVNRGSRLGTSLEREGRNMDFTPTMKVEEPAETIKVAETKTEDTEKIEILNRLTNWMSREVRHSNFDKARKLMDVIEGVEKL